MDSRQTPATTLILYQLTSQRTLLSMVLPQFLSSRLRCVCCRLLLTTTFHFRAVCRYRAACALVAAPSPFALTLSCAAPHKRCAVIFRAAPAAFCTPLSHNASRISARSTRIRCLIGRTGWDRWMASVARAAPPASLPLSLRLLHLYLAACMPHSLAGIPRLFV